MLLLLFSYQGDEENRAGKIVKFCMNIENLFKEFKSCNFLFNKCLIFLPARADADNMARKAQVLWSACQALFRSLKAGCPGREWKLQIRPLDPEISAVERAAGKLFTTTQN